MERSPIVAELVLDGLIRGLGNPLIEKICKRIDFSVGESRDCIKTLEAGQFDVLYIDPMYPEKKKSALPKKEMRILQKFFENQPSDAGLIKEVFKEGSKKFNRVVVKRPLNGPELEKGVKVKFKGSSTRFDVYIFEN